MMEMRIRKSGKFKTGAGLEEAFVSSGATDAGANELVSVLASNTPVVSGLGAASWRVNEAHWLGNSLISNVENTAENKGVRYIPIANVRSKLHHGFIQRGVEEAKERTRAAVRSRVTAIKDHLWEQTK